MLLSLRPYLLALEIHVFVELWRGDYNAVRPHSPLGRKAPQAVQPYLRKRQDCHIALVPEKGAG